MLIPRELYVAPSGSVLVTGMGGYQVIAAPNAEGERAVSSLQGDGPAMLLGPVADEARSRLYIPNIMRDEIWVVDMNTWGLVRRLPVTGGEDANAPIGVHGVEIDSTRGELYVSAQGRAGKNGGLYVLSFEGEHLAYLPFGKMPPISCSMQNASCSMLLILAVRESLQLQAVELSLSLTRSIEPSSRPCRQPRPVLITRSY